MSEEIQKVKEWVQEQKVRILNVAGPREGEAPGIHSRALLFLREVLRMV